MHSHLYNFQDIPMLAIDQCSLSPKELPQTPSLNYITHLHHHTAEHLSTSLQLELYKGYPSVSH